MKRQSFRLPKHIRPISYEVELATDPTRPDFSGHVSMALDIQAPSPAIVMHARELSLSQALLSIGDRKLPLSVSLDPLQESVTFTPPAPLVPGRATLHVAFHGPLNPSMHGLYLATDGTGRAICTQCEATDARGIFPCFDEPEFKATLKWTLHTERGLCALSNGPLDRVTGEGERCTHHFAATRPVSSYLAAVAIGDFEHSPESVVRGVPLRIYAQRGKASQTQFALRFTERLLPFYEDYFAFPYPYKKYDQVAVPGFDAGAMENIGLVLFRQNLLLMDDKAASWRQEKLIAKVIAHEFAHMWFGNLVTMGWWDDLWLNEAFAEWMAHKAVAVVEPSYLIWNDFQDDKNRALSDDALPTTHPIWTPVETPAEAVEMFDAITYQKGCAVMRMLENFLGEAPFRDGLRSYMKAFAESNATGPDLWQKLGEASGQPVQELMHSWVAQSGFPLLGLSLAGPGRLRLSQRRFFSSPQDSARPCDQLWNVPVVLRYEDTEGIKEHRFILREREQVIDLPTQGPLLWCHGNAGEIGFYRVDLDDPLSRALLGPGAKHSRPVEQMGLIEDQWALVRNGTRPIQAFLEVLLGYTGTEDHNVLRAVVDRLFSLDLLLRDSGNAAARQRLRDFIARRFAAPLSQLGWEVRPGEAQNEIQRRALYIMALSGLARVKDAIAQAERFAAAEREDPRAVDANLAGTFVSIAAKFGDEARYEAFLQTFVARKEGGATPQETQRYLYALAGFRLPGLVGRTLQLLEGGPIPQESVGTLLSQLLMGRHGQAQAWDYLKRTWSSLRDRVGDMGLSRLVESVGHLRADHRQDIVTFFEQHPPEGAERALRRALSALDQREEVRERVTPGLLAYFLALE